MVQTKRNQEVVVTKICFYGYMAKTEWEIKVCVMENKSSVAKMIKTRGNNSMLSSKLHLFLNMSPQCWWIFMSLLQQGFFWWDNWNKGEHTYSNFKTACLVKCLRSMLMVFHKTSITGILSRTLAFSLSQNITVVKRQAFMLYWALHQVWEQPNKLPLYMLLS